jgi:hypothetical protein
MLISVFVWRYDLRALRTIRKRIIETISKAQNERPCEGSAPPSNATAVSTNFLLTYTNPMEHAVRRT